MRVRLKQKYRKRLLHRFGDVSGQSLIDESERILRHIVADHPNLPRPERRHTREIFPRIAVYQALQKCMRQCDALDFLRKLITDESAARARYIAMLTRFRQLRLPVLRLGRKITAASFGDAAGFQLKFLGSADNELRFEIFACPYCRYFTEYGCPELAQVVCESEQTAFGNLPGIQFLRESTLVRGADRCGFRFTAYETDTNFTRQY